MSFSPDPSANQLPKIIHPDQTLCQSLEQFSRLITVVAALRGPNGCPWDKQQTQESLTQYILEESYELVEAIESQVQPDIVEELGDFVFQVVLQAQVARDENKFLLGDVLQRVADKLIERHPHVFGEVKAESTEDVWRNWHKMKSDQAAAKNKPIFNYPTNLPALQAAHKIGVKSKGYDFDWPDAESVFAKVQEEIEEIRVELNALTAVTKSSSATAPTDAKITETELQKKLKHEIGDALFSLAQLARHLDLEPEACAREANRRFERRFIKTLELSGLDRQRFSELPPEQKEELWKKAKILVG